MATLNALLLVNPNSTSGDVGLPQVRQWLDRAGISYIELARETDETPSQSIVRLAGEVNCVIVGGGDGSLNAAVEGLVKTGLPLGVLPMGTANGFARTMGLPIDLETAIEIIARGKTVQIDLGVANDHFFFNVASVGFSAELAKSLTEGAKSAGASLAKGVLSRPEVMWRKVCNAAMALVLVLILLTNPLLVRAPHELLYTIITSENVGQRRLMARSEGEGDFPLFRKFG